MITQLRLILATGRFAAVLPIAALFHCESQASAVLSSLLFAAATLAGRFDRILAARCLHAEEAALATPLAHIADKALAGSVSILVGSTEQGLHAGLLLYGALRLLHDAVMCLIPRTGKRTEHALVDVAAITATLAHAVMLYTSKNGPLSTWHRIATASLHICALMSAFSAASNMCFR